MKKLFTTLSISAFVCLVWAQAAQPMPAQPQSTAPANAPYVSQPVPFAQQFANPLGRQAVQPAQAERSKPDPEKFAKLFPPIEGVTDKIGEPVWRNILYAAATLLILAAVVLAFVLRRRKVPEIPPYEKAVARIGMAQERAANTDAKTFAADVSQAVRDYIEAVHNIPAPERTTEEFLKILAFSDAFDDESRDRLRDILTLSDMAKFAKHSFKDAEKNALARSALEFVDGDNARLNAPEKKAASEPDKAESEEVK